MELLKRMSHITGLENDTLRKFSPEHPNCTFLHQLRPYRYYSYSYKFCTGLSINGLLFDYHEGKTGTHKHTVIITLGPRDSSRDLRN